MWSAHATQPSRLPEVTVYYRTFLSMWKEGAYDWEAELTETLEHELEHHDAFLRGHDPKDEEERDEIAREARRLHGTKATAKATVRAFGADFGEFLRRTWPLWVLALIGLAVVIWVLPRQVPMPGGMKRHRIRARAASIASVMP